VLAGVSSVLLSREYSQARILTGVGLYRPNNYHEKMLRCYNAIKSNVFNLANKFAAVQLVNLNNRCGCFANKFGEVSCDNSENAELKIIHILHAHL
jgi:hypothetical protein